MTVDKDHIRYETTSREMGNAKKDELLFMLLQLFREDEVVYDYVVREGKN